MSALKQISAVTGMSIGSLPQRLGTSSVIIIGIAGVVAVLVSVLAMATGFKHTVATTGRDDRAIALRGGSDSELGSTIARDAALTILDLPGVRHGAGWQANRLGRSSGDRGHAKEEQRCRLECHDSRRWPAGVRFAAGNPARSKGGCSAADCAS